MCALQRRAKSVKIGIQRRRTSHGGLLHQQTEINRSRAKSRAVISFLLSKRHTRQRRPLRHTACATSPASAEEAELPRLQASPATAGEGDRLRWWGHNQDGRVQCSAANLSGARTAPIFSHKKTETASPSRFCPINERYYGSTTSTPRSAAAARISDGGSVSVTNPDRELSGA